MKGVIIKAYESLIIQPKSLLERESHMLLSNLRRCRNAHSVAYQVPFANTDIYTDIYRCSFSPQTIMEWNALSDFLVFSAECAKDDVAKFTSLVRARD